MSWNYSDICKMIEHALLKPTLTAEELDAGCQMARAYDIASVCIMPFAVSRCAELLNGSTVAPSTTIGFPHGASTTRDKVHQSETALADAQALNDLSFEQRNDLLHNYANEQAVEI